MNVIKPSIPMRSEPDEMSELETECLFGETVKVLDENITWYYCELLTDNYMGWVQKKNLGNILIADLLAPVVCGIVLLKILPESLILVAIILVEKPISIF